MFLVASSLMPHTALSQFDRNYFFFAGRNSIIDSRYSEAIETLNILLRVDPNAHEAYFLRGVAKYNLDDLYGAEQDFTTAIDKNPVYTFAYYYRGITRARLGNYGDALNDFDEAVGLRPDMPGPYYSRGVTYLMNQQFESAIADFDEFLKFDPKFPDAYANKGTAYLHLKDTVRAFSLYEQALSINRRNPNPYNRRGAIYLEQGDYQAALRDFNTAISVDSTYILSWFNRAITYSNTNRPVDAINDFTSVIKIDSLLSLAWFNRAILRSQIGDYNNALSDYDRVAALSPGNVLVYYNRALLNSQLGNIEAAVNDYTKAIELYPDFANAYLGRASLRYLLRDEKGYQADKNIADAKIAEYRANLADSTYSSVYADTSRQFNRLLSFGTDFSGAPFNTEGTSRAGVTLQPLFKFSLMKPQEVNTFSKYINPAVDNFIEGSGIRYLCLTNRDTDFATDSILTEGATTVAATGAAWKESFLKGVTQYLFKQYTNAITSYTKAIEEDPSNPFLYMNRSTTQSEMTDFISSIDNYSDMAIDSDPVYRLKNTGKRTYSYDEAIADLNKAAKLLPDFAHIYYNRGNLHCISGDMPAALEDYTRAIELYPSFAEAYFNRGLVQIYLKDTNKGLLDISKAGELGIADAYEVLKKYGNTHL